MAFTRYHKSNINTATSPMTVATGTGTTDVVIGLNVANTDGSATSTFDAYITDGTSTLAYLAKDVKVPVGGSIELIQGKVLLGNGDTVVVNSDNEVDVWMSVLEDA